MDIFGGLVSLLGGCVLIYRIWRGIWGTCSYCGSNDIVIDGLYYYCNDCKRKS